MARYEQRPGLGVPHGGGLLNTESHHPPAARGRQDDTHTMGSYGPRPCKEEGMALEQVHPVAPMVSPSSLPPARAAGTQVCVHLARDVRRWTHSPLSQPLHKDQAEKQFG